MELAFVSERKGVVRFQGGVQFQCKVPRQGMRTLVRTGLGESVRSRKVSGPLGWSKCRLRQ